MGTKSLKRMWCRKCEDYKFHTVELMLDESSDVICSNCNTKYIHTPLKDIPSDKAAEQRERYIKQKSDEFKALMNYAANGYNGSIGSPSAIEDDAGQIMIEHKEKLEQVRKDNENLELKLKFKNAERNKPCPCGSGIKYKKCCRDKVMKLR